MTHDDMDLTNSERIIEAAARGETVPGFEALSETLAALHDPAPGTAPGQAPNLAEITAARGPGRLGRRVAVAAVAASVALSGAAAALEVGPMADDSEAWEEAADTDFNFGYDEENQVLVWNILPHDDDDGDESDCELGDEPVEISYGVDDGEISASIDDSECEFMATEIAGPNGQVNHGQFMKAFNEMYEGTGRGCINRFLAQSDLGKGDQQIKVGDVDPDFESVMDGDIGEIDFETALADCEKPNKGDDHPGKGGPHADDDDDEDKRQGKPESPGKSGDAPGRNK